MIRMNQPVSYKVKPIVGSHRLPIRCTPVDDYSAQMRELAINIAFGSDDPYAPASDRVCYYFDEFPEELPEWFSPAHHAELINLIEQA